jgi:YD repeat-containing protein
MNSKACRFAFVCSALALFLPDAYADGLDEPIPSFYQEAGGSSRRDDLIQHPSERVDPFTGKVQWHHVDLSVPGNGGLDIKVQRSYSSLNETLPDDSAFGAGWTVHFGRVMRKQMTNICQLGLSPTINPVLELSDGSRQIMYDAPDGSGSITPNRFKGTCAPGGNGLIVHSPDGTTYEMTTVGAPIVGSDPAHPMTPYYTTRIVDRNGNTLNFTYQMLNGSTFAVTAIDASDGRHVTFAYDGGKIKTIASGNQNWAYSLTPIQNVPGNQYTLDKVTRPDGTSWNYTYNGAGSGPGQGTPGGWSLSSVTYPTSGQISYTYKFVTFAANPSIPVSTVAATKVTSDGTWTFNYVPASQQIVVGSDGNFSYSIDPSSPVPQFDTFTMSGPEGTYGYQHIGYNSAPAGLVYLIGTLAGKWDVTKLGTQTATTMVESESHGKSLISNQTNIRPGNALTFDDATYVPIVTRRSIGRFGRTFTTTFSNFDAYDNPQTIVEAGSDTRTTTLTYYTDPVKWILHQKKDETTDTIGTITRTFDGNGNLGSETKYGVATSFTYTGEGDIATKTDANQNATTYTSYMRGIPQGEAQPEGVNITRSVSGDGNIMSQTDGEGATTGYGYDGLNRLISITHPIKNSVTVAWNANSRTVTRGAYQEVVTFDGYGRQIQVKHTDTAAGTTITQDYQVDVLGRRTWASYPNASIGTGFFYDLEGTTLGVYHGYNPSGTGPSSTRTFVYNGDQVQMTNERNLSYLYGYRSYGDPDHRDLMGITTPEASASIAMQRNGLGQISQVTQDGKTRSYGYDGHYFLTSMTDPEVGTTIYGRDAVGNMSSRQVGSSPTTSYGYDGRNRVKTITYPAGTPSVTKTYYRDDKPKSSDNGVARHDYAYDPNKNLTQETLTITGQTPFVIGYGYDDNDALSTMTYGSGRVVTYSPDAFGRPTRASPYVTSVTHHPNGQVASLTYANGITTTIGLNPRQWPTTMSTSGSTGIFNMTYTYDELGNVFGINDVIDTSYNRGMDYDGVDRLTTANGSWGYGTISYNGHGDITTQSLGSSNLTYAYDGNNRLSGISGSRTMTFGYDVYGNVTSNGALTFGYNDASNMTCVSCGSGNQTTYDYDAGNMRVRSTSNGTSTYFVYGSNGSLLWETIPGSSLTEYIYLHGKQVATRHKTGS